MPCHLRLTSNNRIKFLSTNDSVSLHPTAADAIKN
jgi:hypothetical protein